MLFKTKQLTTNLTNKLTSRLTRKFTFMTKKRKTALASLLTMGLFVGTLTAAPHPLSADASQLTVNTPPAATSAQSPAPAKEIAAVTPEPASPASAPASQAKPQNSATARLRTQSQPSVSRGTVRQPSSSLSSQKAAAVIDTAKQYMGVKYVWGGTTPQGFDCSGFTQYVFGQHGISLPRVSRDQYNMGQSVSFSQLQPGDLVFFSLDQNPAIDHVGIYIGNGEFINASTSKGVTIYSLGSYWQSHYVGAKRVL